MKNIFNQKKSKPLFDRIIDQDIALGTHEHDQLLRRLNNIGIAAPPFNKDDRYSLSFRCKRGFKLSQESIYALLATMGKKELSKPNAITVSDNPFDGLSWNVSQGHCFEFGRIDITEVQKQADRGEQWFCSGIMKLPFPVCCFSATVASEGRPDVHNIIIAEQIGASIRMTLLNHIVDAKLLVFKEYLEITPDQDAAKFRLIWENASFQAVNTTELTVSNLLCLLMILNTKGVSKHSKLKRSSILPKTNNGDQAREVTYINANQYINAVSNRTGDKKAPHIRRGHIRRQASGETTWVKDCLVNFEQDTKRSKKIYNADRAKADILS